jgi:hypothetical protein
MSKERDLLKKILATGWLDHELSCEVEELLAQPEQEPVNFDLERMKLAVESPVSDITVEGLTAKVKSNREHIVDVTDKVEPVAWMYDLDMMIHPISNTRSQRFGELTAIDPTNRQQDAVNIRPLYTAPPKREPLSDEDICQILLKKEWRGFVDSARAVVLMALEVGNE